MVNEDYEPNELDEQILQIAKEGGRVTPLLLRQKTGATKQTINNRLNQLTAAGWIKKITTGLYEYVEDPRDEDND